MNKVFQEFYQLVRGNIKDGKFIHYDTILEFTRDLLLTKSQEELLEVIKFKPEILLSLKDTLNCGLHDPEGDSLELVRDCIEYYLTQVHAVKIAILDNLVIDDR